MRLLTSTDELSTGCRLHVRYSVDHESNFTYHVRGFIDDVIVVRKWLSSKQRWEYECLTPEFFMVFIRNKNLYIS